ncbi:extracellular solute-binding protein [Alicyclobacillus dauci]|uniref:Extracellular solute-binding protein n=1 Tax=Alicyclobacillus dauci TaxID=1475485 RepID=A0ABY6YXD2_9BACL|nr:extracellular solute-binding protein [Alicyclobacillus dauci]WAH35262.1 extracellular solute-binding protein [Alicyclobacillus dauci]
MLKKQKAFISTSVTVVLAAGVLVTGCGNTSAGGSQSNSSASNASGKASITIWDIQTGQSQQVVKNMSQAFNQSHSSIQSNVQFFENDPYKQKIQISMGAHNPPDIFVGWGGGVLKSYIDAGDVYDLTSALNSDSSWSNRFLPSVMKPVTFNGKVYGIPNDNVQPVMLFYNKQLFKQYNLTPPKTWDDLLNDVKVLKSHNITPISLGGKDQWPDLMYEEYLVDRVGGPTVFNNVVTGKANAWSDPAFMKANTMIQQLVNAGAFEQGFSSVSSNQGEDAALLYTGKAAMELMGSWGFATVLSDDKSFIEQGNLGFATFPTVSGGQGDPNDIVGNPSNYYSISNDSKNKSADVTFLKDAVLSSQNVKDWISIGDVPPVQGIESQLKQATYGDYLSFTYDMVKNAPNFQASWDQALPPSEAQELLTDLSKLFLNQMTPQQFSDDMNKYIKS